MFTLKELLNISGLQYLNEIVCEDLLETTEITRLAVIEPPVEQFVKSNDIVLTTAMGCTDDDDSFLSFVKEIYECKASALLISFKPETTPIPDIVKQYAIEKSFPIIRLPWEYHFADIISYVNEGLKAKETLNNSLYLNLQNTLINAYLEEKSLYDAAHIISIAFNGSVTIYDRYQQIKGEHSVNRNTNDYNFTSDILVNGALYGNIEISGDLQTTIADNSLFMTYLGVPLSLWFNKEDVINLTSMLIKNDFIWRLTDFNEDNQTKLLSEGEKMGFDLSAPYIAIICKPVYKYQQFNTQNQSSTHFNINTIESIIIEECRALKIKPLVTANEGIFLSYIDVYEQITVNTLIDNLTKRLSMLYNEYDFYWGIGDMSPIPYTFRKQFKKAKLALEQCINSNIVSKRLTYKQSRITSIVYQYSENAELINQAKEILGCLISIDSESGKSMDLMLTLVTFFKCNYNTSLTARELHLHRQSLLYRLDKIEQLTGFCLSNHDDLFILEFYSRLILKF